MASEYVKSELENNPDGFSYNSEKKYNELDLNQLEQLAITNSNQRMQRCYGERFVREHILTWNPEVSPEDLDDAMQDYSTQEEVKLQSSQHSSWEHFKIGCINGFGLVVCLPTYLIKKSGKFDFRVSSLENFLNLVEEKGFDKKNFAYIFGEGISSLGSLGTLIVQPWILPITSSACFLFDYSIHRIRKRYSKPQ